MYLVKRYSFGDKYRNQNIFFLIKIFEVFKLSFLPSGVFDFQNLKQDYRGCHTLNLTKFELFRY